MVEVASQRGKGSRGGVVMVDVEDLAAIGGVGLVLEEDVAGLDGGRVIPESVDLLNVGVLVEKRLPRGAGRASPSPSEVGTTVYSH